MVGKEKEDGKWHSISETRVTYDKHRVLAHARKDSFFRSVDKIIRAPILIKAKQHTCHFMFKII
jgi:hypothetical protein